MIHRSPNKASARGGGHCEFRYGGGSAAQSENMQNRICWGGAINYREAIDEPVGTNRATVGSPTIPYCCFSFWDSGPSKFVMSARSVTNSPAARPTSGLL